MVDEGENGKNIAGGDGIFAHGDVSFGDISGQVAIGKFINQFKIEKPSGEALVELMASLDKKRNEAFNKEIQGKYNLSELPEYPPRLKDFVTRNRADRITEAMIYLQEHRILLISGMGGIGKTTLARALVETRPANVPHPFWFDFRENMDATLGDVLEKLAGYMNVPDIARFKMEKRDAEKEDINRLMGELRKQMWLIFDNLETALDGTEFHDPGMDMLFTSLRGSSHSSKIILTSRILPTLRNKECLIDVIEEEKQELKGLSLDFAVDYLKKNGLDEVELRKLEELAKGVDGHPLALKLLIELVKKFGISDTLKDLGMFKARKEGTIKKARNLFDKLAGDEKELLERISVFRQPETKEGIEYMFTDRTSRDAIERQMDRSLLETDKRGKFWLHPLVREFSYDDLKNSIDVHKIACRYYLSITPEKRTKKEDVKPLIEAQYHACMAKEYKLAQNIISKNNLHEDLDRWGESRALIDIYSRMLPKDPLKDKPILDIGTHGVILGNLGSAYRHLGLVEKAIEHYKQALEISREIGDRRNEGNWLGNLGIVYSDLGQVKKAIEYYGQALAISREIGHRRNEGAWLGNLGTAYKDLGQVEKAIEYYEQALAISREIGDRWGEEADLGNLGIAYSDLGQIEKAIEYYGQALAISREIGDRRGEGNGLGILGSAYIHFGQVEKAIEYYEQALVISREIGHRRNEGAWLGNLGSAYDYLGQVEKAIEYYEQALAIGKSIKDPRIIAFCEHQLAKVR